MTRFFLFEETSKVKWLTKMQTIEYTFMYSVNSNRSTRTSVNAAWRCGCLDFGSWSLVHSWWQSLRSIRGGGEVGFCSIRGGGVGHCKLAIVTGVPLRGVTCEAVSPSSSSISSSVPSESASHSSESTAKYMQQVKKQNAGRCCKTCH